LVSPSNDEKSFPNLASGDFEDMPTKIGSVEATPSKVQPRDRAYLIVVAGENVGQMFRIERSETVIGRASDATIRLQDDDGVSRRHAKIVQADGQLWIEDLKSANGTLVNGERAERCVLRDGDKIRIGSTVILRFSYSDQLDETFQQKMYKAALHDGLTHAYNKRHFLDRLPMEVAYARRHRTPLSLLMLDIDHFKGVNDSFGHPAGDYVLVTLAQLVIGTLRNEDLFARYGGEEFSILCRGVALPNALLLAERLRSLVESFVFEYDGQRILITVSLGVGSATGQTNAAMQLIAEADAALYDAKRRGRNRVAARTHDAAT
jgi:two-component system cell cycle response regulator